MRVQRVWALIYPPSYQPPQAQEDLVWETVTSVNLAREGLSDWYTATYPGFTERGAYRVVFYAEDGEELQAQPVALAINTGTQIYLPLVLRPMP